MGFLPRAAVVAALVTLGCSSSTAPSAQLSGTWTHDYSIPGMGFEMTLATQGDVVSGSGTWSGEACCSGTVSVVGVFANGVVKIDVTQTATAGALVPQFTSHFEGSVVFPGGETLSGTLTSNGQSQPYTYRKVQKAITSGY